MESIEFNDFEELYFGENPHQYSALAKIDDAVEYELLNDGELGYIDYLNLSVVLEVIAEFFDVNAVAVAKENLLSSVALGSNLINAFDKALDCDPISAYRGTVGFTKEVDLQLAKHIVSASFRNVLSTSFSKEAVEFLKNKNINIVKIKSPLQELLGFCTKDIKITPFGALIQEQNNSKLTKDNFKVVTKTKPTQQLAEDAIFAWKISKHLKNRSAVVVKDLATCAIVQAMSNGIIGAEMAMDYACEKAKGAVLALDGIIETKETINSAIQSRIGLIIESGQSADFQDIIKIANMYELTLIATGLANNKY